MKSTILNLIAVATLLFGWTVQAANEAAQTTQPAVAQPAVGTTPPAAATPAVPTETIPVTAAPTTAEKQPPVRRSKLHKHAQAKHERSKSLDLRHCLDLTTYIEIAQCAGE
jgi:hypothetical protein